MGPQSCLRDSSVLFAADASAAINLVATGYAAQILRALPNTFVMVDVVLRELEQGQAKGRGDAKLVGDLVEGGLVDIVELGDVGAQHFENLTIGTAAETLDDGEAATIAYAAERNTGVVIDERKGLRICAARFATLPTAVTVDLLAHDAVQAALGREALAEAIFNALNHARMRVPGHHLEWTVDLIGNDRAASCRSLPSSVRSAMAKLGSEK